MAGDIRQGKLFNTFEQFTLLFQQYQDENKQLFSTKNSKKLTSVCKDGSTYNPDLIFDEIHYACVKGGEFKSKGNNIRRRETEKTNCPAAIKLRATSNKQQLCITKFNEQHNHDPIAEEIISKKFKKNSYPSVGVAENKEVDLVLAALKENICASSNEQLAYKLKVTKILKHFFDEGDVEAEPNLITIIIESEDVQTNKCSVSFENMADGDKDSGQNGSMERSKDNQNENEDSINNAAGDAGPSGNSPSARTVLINRKSDPPSAPTKPEIVSRTPSTCTLTWGVPENIGSYPIVGYHVEKRKENGDWLQCTKDPVPNMSFSVQDLEAGCPYELRVIAVNAAGSGKPSPSSTHGQQPAHTSTSQAWSSVVKTVSSSMSDEENAVRKVDEKVTPTTTASEQYEKDPPMEKFLQQSSLTSTDENSPNDADTAVTITSVNGEDGNAVGIKDILIVKKGTRGRPKGRALKVVGLPKKSSVSTRSKKKK